MLLHLDFETFYSDEYSLKKMTPPEYIFDPRWETIGCSAAVDDETPHWVDGPDFPSYIAQFDPAKTTTVTFNALFDNCILAWRYGFIPTRMYCAMRLAAALRGHVLSGVSLGVVSKHLGLGEKGHTLKNVKGMRRQEIMNDPWLWQEFQNYCNNDNHLSRAIFNTLIPELPPSERRVMDLVLRCAVQPEFVADTEMLRQHLVDLEEQQAEGLIAAGAQTTLDDPEREGKLESFAATLRSSDQFVKVLQDLGIEVAFKPSNTDPERMIPAFAKTDAFMSELQEHDDPVIQALAAARLGQRSTIEKSRSTKVLAIASQPWPVTVGGNMPIPLRYSGAHTHRLSGEWKVNPQNFPTGRGGAKSKLRKSLKAGPGKKVLVGDLSQIECRIAAWLCGETDLMEQFATKKDPYSILATKIFGYFVDRKKNKDQELEGFIGKNGVLGLGFGAGPPKFYNMVLRTARGMKMDMAKLLAVWTLPMASKAVQTYRHTNPNIRKSWRKLDDILDTAWCGATEPIGWGPNNVVRIGEGYVLLPNGMKMVYSVLPRGEDGWSYRYGKHVEVMYGSKFLENIVQALARIVVMNAALRLRDQGLRFVLQSHDELAFIVPEEDIDVAKALVLAEMRQPPSWAPDLPLDAEANYGDSYGDAK